MKTAVRGLLEKYGVDAAFLTHMPTVRWASGFTGSNAVILVRQGDLHFLSDMRYAEQARKEVSDAKVHTTSGDIYGYVQERGLLDRARTVLIQTDHIAVSTYWFWQSLWPHVKWVPGELLLAREMATKTDEEIALMRRAQLVTDAALENVIRCIRPGMTEQDLAAEIVYQTLCRGAERMSFNPIVSSGYRGSLPHARPSSKALDKGELLVLDFGCVVDGYVSDLTRTLAIGEPGSEARAAYDVVLEAQKRAMDAVRPGILCRQLDAVARNYIEESGYGGMFVHSLGHGIGTEVHEWPRLSHWSDAALPENATVTLEPGIYVPDRFGIRIEDTVVVTRDGARRLGKSSQTLKVV